MKHVFSRPAAGIAVMLVPTGVAHDASLIVAAANSTPESKTRADYVCDGKDDQIELLASITRAPTFPVKFDTSPGTQTTIKCFGRHSVEWLPGDYHLTKTLTIPDAADVAIRAEGTYFHYQADEGDAVVITGMLRCRYNFGTIQTHSAGAAIRVAPTRRMPALMSVVRFTGLVGTGQKGIGQKGIGLCLDSRVQGVCVNKFAGTDISGFDTGVFVSDAVAKCDTNWFWLSYIRLCHICIWEKGRRVDDNVWNVNVDASLPTSTAIRTAAKFGRWYIIMGTWKHEGVNKAIVLEPGARHNVLEVHPPIENFAWEDNSGNTTNVLLSTKRPPYHMPVNVK